MSRAIESAETGQQAVLESGPSSTTDHNVDPSPTVRRSSRGVKRKKLDDGMVDSGVIGTKSGRRLRIFDDVDESLTRPMTRRCSAAAAKKSEPVRRISADMAKFRRDSMQTGACCSNQAKQAHIQKDFTRWQAEDDLALIIACERMNSLPMVHRMVTFSLPFTLQEIEERWYELFYDPIVSKRSKERFAELNAEVIRRVKANTPYSHAEHQILTSIPSTVDAVVERFQTVLSKHSEVFYPGRTASGLMDRWLMLKAEGLLIDQNHGGWNSFFFVFSISHSTEMDKEKKILFSFLILEPSKGRSCGGRKQAVSFMAEMNKSNDRETPDFDLAVHNMPVITQFVTNALNASFSADVLAVLRGRVVEYLIQVPEVVVGHRKKTDFEGVDLSYEGPCGKISRRQAVISYRSNSKEFIIFNEGSAIIYVDGKACNKGSSLTLKNNSVIEITVIRLKFLINTSQH
ncbi:Microspherule protein 1 [Trichinella zimbabwensis]|uniref:Microspherule protein 1 n=1 Tax=Trichinella zimbabwensis TaxID=268475 RepID=A0A0V1HY83_9BILA|nr:Microspherule protein 1 [Trichinella zimbabwensis]